METQPQKPERQFKTPIYIRKAQERFRNKPENREAMREYQKIYLELNRDKILDYKKEYYQKNKARLLAMKNAKNRAKREAERGGAASEAVEHVKQYLKDLREERLEAEAAAQPPSIV
jgi:hypothetical protein